MSDITLRLAEACERAAEYAQALVHIGYDDVFWGSGVTTIEEAMALVESAEANIEKYRALAAALRGGDRSLVSRRHAHRQRRHHPRRRMSETPERLPYEPMDERQRAIDMVRSLEVTKDGDVFDLIARLLRDVDRIEWLSELRWAEIGNNAHGSCVDGPDVTQCGGDTLREAIDTARRSVST